MDAQLFKMSKASGLRGPTHLKMWTSLVLAWRSQWERSLLSHNPEMKKAKKKRFFKDALDAGKVFVRRVQNLL